MPDMLVRLYDLHRHADPRLRLPSDVAVRTALAPEKRLVCGWVASQFGDLWASECEIAFARMPIACIIAIREGTLAGFACHDVTARGFFGPTGLAPEHRGSGLGSALLFAGLEALRELGFAYGIIGAAGPLEFYRKTVGAIEIPGSVPGFYRGLLRTVSPESAV